MNIALVYMKHSGNDTGIYGTSKQCYEDVLIQLQLFIYRLYHLFVYHLALYQASSILLLLAVYIYYA